MTTIRLPDDHERRLGRARLSLEGLSVGDAFGERFFTHPDVAMESIWGRVEPRPPWSFTDDTGFWAVFFQGTSATNVNVVVTYTPSGSVEEVTNVQTQ